MAEIDAIRHDFFARDDKKDMLKCLNSLSNPQKSTENMFLSIVYSLERDLNEIKSSGFKWFVRGVNPDWMRTRKEVERQLELIEPG